MKKIISLLLLLSLLTGLVACGGGDYAPVPSTDEEARAVMTFEYENEKYEVRYELYRALFLAHRDELDGGDGSLWTGEGSDGLIDRMNGLIADYAARIFGTLHLAKRVGIDPYSSEFDDLVREYVRLGVEGDGISVSGAGSYEKYLGMLREMGLNYSVQDLVIRYSIALEKLGEYYIGTHDDALGTVGGKLDADEEKLREYYNSDECVRVIRVYLQAAAYTEKRANEIRDEIALKSSAADVSNYAIQFTTSSFEEIFDGIVIGAHAASDSYAEYTEAAFSTGIGETSAVVPINTGSEDGYYIFYGVEKSDAHFEKNLESIKESYLDNEIGKLLDEVHDALAGSLKLTTDYYGIDHSKITME